MQNKVLFYQY